MGYARLTAVSKFVNTTLKKGPATIAGLADAAVTAGLTVPTPAMPLSSHSELANMIDYVLNCLCDNGEIKGHPMTRKQKLIFKAWKSDGMCGVAEIECLYSDPWGIMDSIEFTALTPTLSEFDAAEF
jgi:hypothetical protein